jgi:leucyl-tRNA synthetase
VILKKAAPWNSASIKGCKRFVDRVWALGDMVVPGEDALPAHETLLHKTIKKVTEDVDNLKGKHRDCCD